MHAYKFCFALVGMVALSACSGTPLWGEKDSLDISGDYKIGQPYQISGVWYYPHHDPEYDEIGIASWYGPGFHGNTTANGEVFDQNALTAAHPTLPMPVLVRVTNLENGRSLQLRVNDRGPFVDGRIIDVSRFAAERLGFRHQGLAWVRVQYVSGGPGSDIIRTASRPTNVDNADAQSDAHLFVQAEAVDNYANAVTLRDSFREFGYARIDEITVNGSKFYGVRFGPWKDRQTAYGVLQRIISRGHTSAQVIAVEERIVGGEELLLLR